MNQTLSTIETYECFGAIGSGSVSTIYEGYDHVLKRDVAIKELRPEFRAEADVVESFWGEATMLAGLNHANVLRVYGIDHDRFWILMEPMLGSLATEVAKTKLAASRVREILKQILEGLRYLHSMDRCHGQICLDSLLIDHHGNVKLSNLGEAGHDGEFRCPDEKHLHCAPEILNPKHFGQPGLSADLYCVGLVALQLLTGDKFIKLFKGMDRKRQLDPVAWSAWHASSDPIGSVQAIVSDIPADLVALIEGLTQKQVGLRFATAAEAIGAISPQHSAVSSETGSGLSQSAVNGESGGDEAAVTYNSPNLYSPMSSVPSREQAVTWQSLLREASGRVSRIGMTKVLAAAGAVVLGFLMLLVASSPAQEQAENEVAVDVPEESTETEPLPSPPPLYAPPIPEVAVGGSAKLVISHVPGGPSLDSLSVYIDYEEHAFKGLANASGMLDRPEDEGKSTVIDDDFKKLTVACAVKNDDFTIIKVTGPAKTYNLRVKAVGYELFQDEISISAGSHEKHSLELKIGSYDVDFAIEPATAILEIDGEKKDDQEILRTEFGTTRRVRLPWGKHYLAISADGHKAITKEIVVTPSLSETPIRLERLAVVSARIESFPNGAKVFMNGKCIGTTPFCWTGIEGQYRIEMERDGYSPLVGKFTADSSEENPRLCWYLERSESTLANGDRLTKMNR